MVSVRKSHQLSTSNFDSHLAQLNLPKSKHEALTQAFAQLAEQFEQSPNCQVKATEMVEILASLNMDEESLVAAMLVPLFDAKQISLEHIELQFGPAICTLVDGVHQMDAIRSLQQPSGSHFGSMQIDNIRKMLLSMVADVRAVVIKLAERVCNLREVKNKPEDEKVLAAKETANIYAPLANRLGIGQIKWELEDISFRYLHPKTYKKIAELLDETRLEREQYMVDFVASVQQQLDALGIKGTVYGRPKHIFSIWKKMQKKSLDFDQLFDVRAIRIIVEKLQDCYGALGAVHTSWKHLPSEFDDYVATPKANGYQSIHTVVFGPSGKTVEIQIRTQQMHDDAELGVAAHWRYKEGSAGGKDGGFDEKINWLRKLLQWQEDVQSSDELVDEIRNEVFEDRIYVFTPNGDVIDLPNGATPLDFAYYIHSNVGHCCIGAKVDGRIVPFTYKLHTGEQVDILTSKQPNPSPDWVNPSLGYIFTARARSKVQSFFKSLDRDKHEQNGKELLEQALHKNELQDADLKPVLRKFNVKSIADLHVAIGSGHAKVIQVVNVLKTIANRAKTKNDIDPKMVIKANTQKSAVDDNGITVSGVGNLLTHMAKCCHPVPGDEILGFITHGRGISVHRRSCEQLKQSLQQSPERQVEVQWGETFEQHYQVEIKITTGERQGLLRDLTTVIANEKVNVLDMSSRYDARLSCNDIRFKLQLANIDVLSRLINKLDQIDDVIAVERLRN
ncbi:GTP diphosphokinase [Thalassotalea ponticola]|uniref:GTP diphosphokinase n=1 Tax=Thalassotalea ponticola TaxID=1523392 RepID=UPI0025B60542|nr:GTP diphosphokinase [Thalassotalea ponticola]MDN3652125.1 GTP diphosphokinase [Thalassotalea ponticola]